jgi:transposase-like protein
VGSHDAALDSVTNESPACPFCESHDTERVAQWGGQLVTSQWRCRGCGSYFEALREDFATTSRHETDVVGTRTATPPSSVPAVQDAPPCSALPSACPS